MGMLERVAVIAMVTFFALPGAVSYGEGVSTLIELGKSQTEIMKDYEYQTKVFKGVKTGVQSGAIKKGMTRDSIKSLYGDAVVNVKDIKTGRDKWIYMPEISSFFKGEKIYLYFTDNGILDEISTVQ